LGANVVVELYSKSHARRPTTRAWAIIRRASAATGWRAGAPAASNTAAPTEPTAPAGCINARSSRRRPMLADRPVPAFSWASGEQSGSGPICSRPRPALRSARVQNFLNLGRLPVRCGCRMAVLRLVCSPQLKSRQRSGVRWPRPARRTRPPPAGSPAPRRPARNGLGGRSARRHVRG
jgi:hypothetical protein